MLKHAAPVAAAGVFLVGLGVSLASAPDRGNTDFPVAWQPLQAVSEIAGATDGGAVSDNEVIRQYCVRCHNERRLLGNMSLEAFDATDAPANGELAEKMIRKLRAGLMPPPGNRRPEEPVLTGLVESLESQMDLAAAENPNPGRRTFQRLNRAEYQASIRDLLDLQIDAGAYLPLDTKSANFDNIADAQILSATLTDGYLRAAAEISRLAIGDPHITPSESTYRVSRWDSQSERVAGAPYGTRGGVSVLHNFPADGHYAFRVSFHHETTGALVGNGRNALHTEDGDPELLEISVDGEPVAVLEVNRWMHTSDPDGVNIRSERVFVRAGPRQVSAAFIRRSEGPLQDLISPHDWSLASTSIAGSYGFTVLPHLRDLAIGGPYDPQGVSDTPSRRAVFACRPGAGANPGAADASARGCAHDIVARLGTRAYRRPLTEANMAALMGLYDLGAEVEGFEGGVRIALEGILASPHFIFRIEEPTVAGAEGSGTGGRSAGAYRIGDHDLAARLSFFLWGSGPDEQLMAVAREGRLSERTVLEGQVHRMLRDPRSAALSTRFAGQWLRLQDLEKIQPDPRVNPDFDEPLKRAMLEETETFFDNLVREDASVTDLYDADYTFVNERLARHYGIPDVAGNGFQRVRYLNEERRGLLGHGSILTLTSHAGRTSPVLRGKWVMEVFLGTPPPPPPPDVPELEEEAVGDGRFLTVRERLEMHAANPTCNSCHRMIDPIGLALENFDVTGAWRIRDQGVPIDAASDFYDGTPISTPSELRAALLKRPEPLLRTFTENLMAYALGRRLEYYDMPAVRRITRAAAEEDYRVSAFIVGVATSDAFLLKAAPVVVDGEAPNGNGG
ncbi:MAG: DUF1592 domain-containing protein [Gemmatimonadota bacterium]|nr:DUF1592 domain-containing protein [Gemmatimonadota bacterium]